MTAPGRDERRFLDYPFHVGGEGGVALTSADDHLRDLIEQVLFTNPGERVNLPDFGCGLRNLVFAGNNEILAATVQFLVSQNLTRWLSDVLTVEQVRITNEEEQLLVEVTYAVRRSRERQRVTVSVARPGTRP
jgi:phage baseplate assembly protein W